MKVPLTLLFAALLLAGCTNDPSGDPRHNEPAGPGNAPSTPGPALPGEPEGEPSIMWLNGTLTGNLTQGDVSSPLRRDGLSLDDVCYHWNETQVFRVLEGGWARAEWDSTSPNHDRLVLRVGRSEGPPYSVEGTSPLTLDAYPHNVTVPGISVGVLVPKNAVVVDQPVRVEWSIPVLGVPGAEPLRSSC